MPLRIGRPAAVFDIVLLIDIGANTLLLQPEVWLHARPFANRLRLLSDWVADGGGLGMIGGYLSFQNINGSARYRATPVAETLLVGGVHGKGRTLAWTTDIGPHWLSNAALVGPGFRAALATC